MKIMGKIIITLFFIITASLFLTSCSDIVTPGLPPNLENSDTNDNTSDSKIIIDKTPPVVTITLPGNGVYLLNQSVTATWTATDALSGVVAPASGTVKLNTSSAGTKTLTLPAGTAKDKAGNRSQKVSKSYKVIIDKTPPVVTITLPGTGVYLLNQSVTATWTATDALSGVVAPASGTVKLNTSSVGTKTLTLPAGTAKDKAGNRSIQVNKSYTVTEAPATEELTEVTETEGSQKWSGLTGFAEWYGSVAGAAGTWLANGFNEARDIRNYLDTANVNGSKAAVIAAKAKGINFIWGVGSGGTTITAKNWPNFRQAILDAAQWAQDNGVYEFQIGNEEELHVDGTTMTVAQIIANLKSVATEVKKIFTNGNVSYSMSWNNDIWRATGKGDIDILGLNVYRGSTAGTFDGWWKEQITANVNAFGVNGLYISEFNLSSENIEYYSTDEKVQAEGLAEMIEYIKASGIERALFYSWNDYPGGLFGVVKDDGTYRLLWSQALLNSDSVKFASVPILLPGRDTSGNLLIIAVVLFLKPKL